MMKRRIYVLKNLRKYVLMVKGWVIALVCINILSVIIALMPPACFQLFIDNVLCSRETDTFWIVVIGLLGAFILRKICSGISLLAGNHIKNSFSCNLRQDILSRYLHAPYSYISKKEPAELKMTMIDDVELLESFIQDQVASHLSSVLMLAVTLTMCLCVSTSMTLCCLLIIAMVFVLDNFVSVKTRNVNDEMRSKQSKYYSSTYSTLQCWREIKIHNAEKCFVDRFNQYKATLSALGYKSIRCWAMREVLSDFKANYLTKMLVYLLGAVFVVQGELSVGTLILFSQYVSYLFLSIDGINKQNVELLANAPYFERIFEVFTYPEDPGAKHLLSSSKLHIKVEDLTCAYDRDVPVLQDVNFEVTNNEIVALVGKTGCGKTTLIKILLGLIDSFDGHVIYNGVDIRQINKQSLLAMIGVVMQDPFLFDTSVRENLLMANNEAAEADIIDACKKANIHDEIQTLPQGYDTKLGENASLLSGGQRQRLAIAAALLKKPKLLILDEATSALDNASQDVIWDAIDKLSQDAAVILITHKPALAQRANQIIDLSTDEKMTINMEESEPAAL